jgi:hypothetical protein
LTWPWSRSSRSASSAPRRLPGLLHPHRPRQLQLPLHRHHQGPEDRPDLQVGPRQLLRHRGPGPGPVPGPAAHRRPAGHPGRPRDRPRQHRPGRRARPGQGRRRLGPHPGRHRPRRRPPRPGRRRDRPGPGPPTGHPGSRRLGVRRHHGARGRPAIGDAVTPRCRDHGPGAGLLRVRLVRVGPGGTPASGHSGPLSACTCCTVTGVGAGLLLLGFAIAELLTPVASR